MGIEKLVEETKRTKDQKNKKMIIEYYEPLFCKAVSRNYGEGFTARAKEVLPSLIDHYFEVSIKSKLCNYLQKSAKCIFNEQHNFDEIINSNNPEYIKKHYIDKFYKVVKEKFSLTVLSDEEMYVFSEKIVTHIYNLYLKDDKKSSVALYFNALMRRKLEYCNNEEKLLLSYANKVGINDKIITYFCYEYIDLLKEFRFININEYRKVIENTLKCFHLNTSIESIIRKNLKKEEQRKIKIISSYVKEIINGNYSNVEFIKQHYSYVIDVVFDNFKNKVAIPQEILKERLIKKYDDYFNDTIKALKNNSNINVQRYINTRLSDYVRRNKYFYTYVDEDEKDKIIDSNADIIDKYVLKYYDSLYYEDMQQDIMVLYYFLAEKYFDKYYKSSFEKYIKSKFVPEVKKLVKRYKTISYFDQKEENPIIK